MNDSFAPSSVRWASRRNNALRRDAKIQKALYRARITPGEAFARAEGIRAYWEARVANSKDHQGSLLNCWFNAGHARVLSHYLSLIADGEAPRNSRCSRWLLAHR